MADARDSAKVEDQVRLLARALSCLRRWSQTARQPPAKRFLSGFDSRQRLLQTGIRSNCRLGIHDGPKVAMPGDRLVNDARVSLRRRGRSTVRHAKWRIRTAVAGMPFSTHLRWINYSTNRVIAAVRLTTRSSSGNKDRLPVWSTWSVNPWSWVRVPPASLLTWRL